MFTCVFAGPFALVSLLVADGISSVVRDPTDENEVVNIGSVVIFYLYS